MVYERVAVVLKSVHGIVAIGLFLAHCVLAVPFQQQVERPCLVGRIRIAGKHVGAPCADFVIVGRSHVEICARKVALIFVDRLEHLTRIARKSRGAEFAERLLNSLVVADCVTEQVTIAQ